LPARLELVEQGAFAIGYWHQRNRRGKTAADAETTRTTEEQAA
jgi:hypothetical protein